MISIWPPLVKANQKASFVCFPPLKVIDILLALLNCLTLPILTLGLVWLWSTISIMVTCHPKTQYLKDCKKTIPCLRSSSSRRTWTTAKGAPSSMISIMGSRKSLTPRENKETNKIIIELKWLNSWHLSKLMTKSLTASVLTKTLTISTFTNWLLSLKRMGIMTPLRSTCGSRNARRMLWLSTSETWNKT
jgi:hypothetical protein